MNDLAESLVEPAIEDARRWLRSAETSTTRHERAVADRLNELVAQTEGLEFTMSYVDRVARHRQARRGADQLRALVAGGPLPRFLGPIDRLLLQIGARLAPLAPGVVMPLARARLRQLVGHLLVDATPTDVPRRLDAVRDDGVTLNVNLLGEEVLGEAEAARRLERTLDLINEPSVTYVSVKPSAIASQLDLWSFDDSVDRVADRLRRLYRAAGSSTEPTFVNLDMEAYADLHLTVAAFTRVLDEAEFSGLDAGIVLQAYLPESFDELTRLAQWADRRHRRQGGRIKVRLVKGANLAVERVEGAMHGWTPAPYPTKADVDANYKRCLDWALDPQRTRSVRIGVASHNLFDLAWARLLADARGVTADVDFEMLQGMAPAHARAVGDDTGDLLLYTPVVAPDDFDAAISYLVRRLEENASGHNFLRHLFDLHPDGQEFADQAQKFRTAVSARRDVVTEVSRHSFHPTIDTGFANHPDTDPALTKTRAWLQHVRTIEARPCVTPVTTDADAVNAALGRAAGAQPEWTAVGAHERRRLLWKAADEIERRRGELLATMADEARKTFAEADPEISEAIDFARWYGDRALELDDIEGVRFTPYGTVAVIPPWNFPVAIPAGGALAALAAGNCAILKPAPETPRCAEIVAEAIHAAGVPVDVFQFVRTPDDDVGRALVTGADAVILTGSIETARLFRSWNPDMVLMGETSGKNALVITPNADVDQAVADLVQSAFGHAGQKCSAASLGILVGDLADDPRFRRQLIDAVTSLRVGWPTAPGPNTGPTIGPVTGKLERALTSLDHGESWLVEPKALDDSGALWAPGVREGVTEGSWFHRTECFGPVLGLMRATDLDHALRLQNGTDFGLTGGIHTLDDDEADTWLAGVEVGNAYINRHITGAIVRRQPFGGWKASSVGLGSKAGGHDYLLQLGRWSATAEPDDQWLADATTSDAQTWSGHYGVTHDPTHLFCEANELRYLPHPRTIIRVSADANPTAVARAASAARRSGASVQVSSAAAVAGVVTDVEPPEVFAERLEPLRNGRIRYVGTPEPAVRRAAADHDIDVIDEAVTPNGRLELRLYLREQAISRTLHRFGNVPRRLARDARD